MIFELRYVVERDDNGLYHVIDQFNREPVGAPYYDKMEAELIAADLNGLF